MPTQEQPLTYRFFPTRAELVATHFVFIIGSIVAAASTVSFHKIYGIPGENITVAVIVFAVAIFLASLFLLGATLGTIDDVTPDLPADERDRMRAELGVPLAALFDLDDPDAWPVHVLVPPEKSGKNVVRAVVASNHGHAYTLMSDDGPSLNAYGNPPAPSNIARETAAEISEVVSRHPFRLRIIPPGRHVDTIQPSRGSRVAHDLMKSLTKNPIRDPSLHLAVERPTRHGIARSLADRTNHRTQDSRDRPHGRLPLQEGNPVRSRP